MQSSLTEVGGKEKMRNRTSETKNEESTYDARPRVTIVTCQLSECSEMRAIVLYVASCENKRKSTR